MNPWYKTVTLIPDSQRLDSSEVSFAVSLFTPSPWEFQTADIPHWWDGLSHLQRQECIQCTKSFTDYLFTLGPPGVHLVYTGLRHNLELLHCGALPVSATLIPLTFAWGHPTFRAIHEHLHNESLWVFERNSMTCNLMEWPHDPMTLNIVEWLSNYSEYLISEYSPYYKIYGVHSNRDRKLS